MHNYTSKQIQTNEQSIDQDEQTNKGVGVVFVLELWL